MAKSNPQILDELDNDMVDCFNHAGILFRSSAIPGMLLNDVVIALFHELQIKKMQFNMDDV